MVNFELDNEMQKVNNMINMTLAWDKQKIWVPDRNQTHDQPNTRQVLCPLNHENSWIELIAPAGLSPRGESPRRTSLKVVRIYTECTYS